MSTRISAKHDFEGFYLRHRTAVKTFTNLVAAQSPAEQQSFMRCVKYVANSFHRKNRLLCQQTGYDLEDIQSISHTIALQFANCKSQLYVDEFCRTKTL